MVLYRLLSDYLLFDNKKKSSKVQNKIWLSMAQQNFRKLSEKLSSRSSSNTPYTKLTNSTSIPIFANVFLSKIVNNENSIISQTDFHQDKEINWNFQVFLFEEKVFGNCRIVKLISRSFHNPDYLLLSAQLKVWLSL